MQISEASATTTAFNCQAVLSCVDDDWRTLMAVVHAFLADCPRLIGTTRQALQARDLVTGRRAAHTLRGAAATAGADAIRGSATQLETALCSAVFTGAGEILDSIESQFALFRSEAEQWIAHANIKLQPGART